MPKIIAGQGVITQVNVFTCDPENQQALIELLIEASEAVCDIPRWVSASLHKSLDGARIVNYAQCESMAAWEQVMARLKEGGFFERNRKLGQANPGLYEVAFTRER